MSHSNQTEERRLHLGCGRDIKPGWINLDHIAGPGIDAVADLDDCANTPLPFEDDSFDEILNGVMTLRNVVHEMCAVLTAVKPMRPAHKELQTRPQIEFSLSSASAKATV